MSSCLDSSVTCRLLLLGLADLASGSPVKPETHVMLQIKESVFSSMNDNDYLFLRQFPDIIWARISAFFGEAKKCRLRGPNYIGETDAGNMSFYS